MSKGERGCTTTDKGSRTVYGLLPAFLRTLADDIEREEAAGWHYTRIDLREVYHAHDARSFDDSHVLTYRRQRTDFSLPAGADRACPHCDDGGRIPDRRQDRRRPYDTEVCPVCRGDKVLRPGQSDEMPPLPDEPPPCPFGPAPPPTPSARPAP